MATATRPRPKGYTSAAIASAATTPIPTTLCATGRRFLLSDLYTSRNKIIIIYMTDSFLVEHNTPGKITTVFIDGTFKVSPKNFAQLWIVRGFIRGICFPLAFFRTNKTLPTSYSRCLQQICTFAPYFSPTLVMLDFELAEHNGLHRVFPNVRKQGCYYHHKQCLHKICCSTRLQRYP